MTWVSRLPFDRRQVWLQGRGFPLDPVRIQHVEADIIASGTLSSLDLGGYDTILVAASSYSESAESSDARALTGYELLRAELQEQCPDASARPKIVLEVSHPASSRFVTEPGDVLIVHPRLLGFLESHVALRPQLNAVFDALFLPTGGANIVLRGDSESPGPYRYSDLVRRSRARGDVALGLLLPAGSASQQVVLCPPEDLEWSGTADLIVLTAETSDR